MSNIVDISTLTLTEQERITAAAYPCPDCRVPMLGARVWDAKRQEAIVGAACRDCDVVYRIVWNAEEVGT